MAPLDTSRTTIAVVLYADLTALDLVGPLQVLAELERFAPRFRTVVVGERAEPMGTDVDMALVPDTIFADLPHPNVLVVPGGRAGTIRALSDPVIRAYVETAAASAVIVASVCTGSLILASTGLLDGRRATTNWAFAALLDRLGGHYVRERWIHDGKLVMSAGVSAGIDMALYLASVLTDETTARRIQQAIDYDPQPPFGGIDWDHLPLPARLVRAGISVAAPFIAAKPKRMTRASRRPNLSGERAL
jgi:transcriptional regulator GlxA family with amidase domain